MLHYRPWNRPRRNGSHAISSGSPGRPRRSPASSTATSGSTRPRPATCSSCTAPAPTAASSTSRNLAISHAGTPLLAGRTTKTGDQFARLLSWVDGTPWAEAGPWEPELLRELGRTVARVDRTLASVDHPSKRRTHRWNILEAPPLTASTPSGLVADALRHFHELRPRLNDLPWQVIHNDANDHNVIVSADRRGVSLIDFGDIVYAPRVCGLAVACAYAMLGQERPVRAILPLVAGYHEESPLLPDELAPLYDLIRTRLAMSVLHAIDQQRDDPENEYLAISQEPIRLLAERLERSRATWRTSGSAMPAATVPCRPSGPSSRT